MFVKIYLSRVLLLFLVNNKPLVYIITPCRAVPCRAVPCRAVPCRAVPCRAVPCRAVPCRAVPCRAVHLSLGGMYIQCWLEGCFVLFFIHRWAVVQGLAPGGLTQWSMKWNIMDDGPSGSTWSMGLNMVYQWLLSLAGVGPQSQSWHMWDHGLWAGIWGAAAHELVNDVPWSWSWHERPRSMNLYMPDRYTCR